MGAPSKELPKVHSKFGLHNLAKKASSVALRRPGGSGSAPHPGLAEVTAYSVETGVASAAPTGRLRRTAPAYTVSPAEALKPKPLAESRRTALVRNRAPQIPYQDAPVAPWGQSQVLLEHQRPYGGNIRVPASGQSLSLDDELVDVLAGQNYRGGGGFLHCDGDPGDLPAQGSRLRGRPDRRLPIPGLGD
ncbi:hypothetical protein M501DRAFT_1014443 [Patellaria atrata CBS 101060]|uniref:Uncharacterized protein n=1 Tax=Patellaria atrata CBS 101060 TaxID=1346257 RepID=A0A9P4SHE8_9PEZI|nr:hypothetical protein M501DRAFT_1014443 [Patellaria atrata CBS 101060]